MSCFESCIECGKPFDETSYTWSMCDPCLEKMESKRIDQNQKKEKIN